MRRSELGGVAAQEVRLSLYRTGHLTSGDVKWESSQRGCRIHACPELTCGCGPVPRRVSVVVRGAPRLLRTLGGWAWGYVAPSLGLGARRCWRRATGVGNQNRVFEGTMWQLAWLRDMTHSARTHSYHANLPL